MWQTIQDTRGVPWLRSGCTPHTRVFLEKSRQIVENKEREREKESARELKSAQIIE